VTHNTPGDTLRHMASPGGAGPVRVETERSIDDYIRAGDENTRELLEANSSLVRALRVYDQFFAKTLWADPAGLRPLASVVALNAHMLWLAAVRLAMTGHAAAVYPVQRTALESACYAFLMMKAPRLEDVWAQRERNREARRACRKAFGSAVDAVARRFNADSPGSGDWILDAYEAAIDFGAHPNARSVLMHVSFGTEEGGNFERLSLAGLHDSKGVETVRALMAGLDYGLAIALILANSLPSMSPTLSSKLDELRRLKREIEAELESRG
jgi:hypothetical protein